MRIDKNTSKEIKVMVKDAKPFAEILSWSPDTGVKLVEGFLTDPIIQKELDEFMPAYEVEDE